MSHLKPIIKMLIILVCQGKSQDFTPSSTKEIPIGTKYGIVIFNFEFLKYSIAFMLFLTFVAELYMYISNTKHELNDPNKEI